MPTSSVALNVGRDDAPRHVLILHGYTGSPDEFRELARALSERLDARVHVPLLPGHGTSEEDLLRFSLEDLCSATEQHVRKIAETGKPFALIGHSLGGHFALLAAARYSPVAAVVSVMPYALRPPFSIPGMDMYARTKTFWDKPLSKKEIEERKEHFYYKRMPGVALGYTKELNRRLAAIAPRLAFPIFAIGNREDPLTQPTNTDDLLAITGKNPRNRSLVFDKKEHGVFYGEGHTEVVMAIADFLAAHM